MNEQLQLTALISIINEFNSLFKNELMKFEVKIHVEMQNKNYRLYIACTSKVNKTIILDGITIFLHPSGSLQFTASIKFKNNNPIINEKYCRDRFSLQDYTTFRKIPYDYRFLWKPVNDYNDGVDVAKKTLFFIKEILLLEEIQKILFSDYWISIPIDYSPYK